MVVVVVVPLEARAGAVGRRTSIAAVVVVDNSVHVPIVVDSLAVDGVWSATDVVVVGGLLLSAVGAGTVGTLGKPQPG